MASVKLTLAKGIWQEVGAFSFTSQKGSGITQKITATTLPVGDQENATTIDYSVETYTPAPASGSWYVRSPYDDSSFTYHEVS